MRIYIENGMKKLRAEPRPNAHLSSAKDQLSKQNAETLLRIETAIGTLPVLSENVEHTLKLNAALLKYLQHNIQTAKQEPPSSRVDEKTQAQILAELVRLQHRMKASKNELRFLFWSIPTSLALLILLLLLVKFVW